MLLAPASRFGKYLIIRRIGIGGMAEVWEAEDQSSGRRVALKVMLDAMADDPKFGERFFREARILSRLQHPHIIPILDFGQEEGDAYLVTPLLLGGSLADKLRSSDRGSQPIEWMKQLASALDFAHGAGVIHRDVKPANVLFDDSGHLYLSDFGLAKAASSRDLTTTGAAMGTPLYMAPEQIRGHDLDNRTDVYGLGIVAYQLVTGHRPFAGDSVATVLHKTLNVMPDPPSSIRKDLPRGVDVVIFRALAKDRRRRYETCSEFTAELEKALAGTPPQQVNGVSLTDEERAALLGGDRPSNMSTLHVGEGLREANSVSVPHFEAVQQTGNSRLWMIILGVLLVAGGGTYAYLQGLLPPRATRTATPVSRPVDAGPPPLSRLMTAKRDIQRLSDALRDYAIDNGRYPPGNWPEAYRAIAPALGTENPPPSKDPWGQSYRYATSADGKTFVILSPGNDAIYQNSDTVISLLLSSGCKARRGVVSGDETTTDIVFCNGNFLTIRDVPPAAP